MIVPGSSFSQVYHAMKLDKYNSEDRAILIFVANIDVDSLCAAQQLQDVFHKDDMHYSLYPVESYDEVRSICLVHGLQNAEDLGTVVMINCGATDDVRELCELHENIRLVIIDSHRPIWHGYGATGEETIVLLDEDDPVKLHDIPQYFTGDEELRLAVDQESSSSDEDDDEGYAEPADSPTSSGASRDRPADRQKGRNKKRRLEWDSERLERQRKIEDYYSLKCGYGKPAALLLLDLAHALQYDNQFHIWLAILGMTDQFMNQHMDKCDYERWRVLMLDRVVALNGNIEEEQRGHPNKASRNRMVVMPLEDLRLTLHRHWTLADSMMYTPYTAARLQTWRDKGQNNLNLLFAKMAVPMSQATIAFSTMKPAFRDSLGHQLNKHAAMWAGLNMEQLRFQSFELQYKNELRLSASDMVHALSAVLARPRSSGAGAEVASCTPTAQDIFHEATDVLYCHRHIASLKAAIERAKMMAKAIVQEGGLAIQRNQIRGSRNGTFWHLNMADLEFSNKSVLHHPVALTNLASFLRTAMAQRSTYSKAVVVIGPPDSEGQCYVVSLRKKQQAGMLQNNPFAVPFSETMAALSIDSKPTFDGAIYKMDRQHAENFIEELKAMVNAHSQDMPDVGAW